MTPPVPSAEGIARAFHEAYERLAPSFGWTTSATTAVPWERVPEANRRLMVAVVREVLGPFPEETARAHCGGCYADLGAIQGATRDEIEAWMLATVEAHRPVCPGPPLCPACKRPVREHTQDEATRAVYCPPAGTETQP